MRELLNKSGRGGELRAAGARRLATGIGRDGGGRTRRGPRGRGEGSRRRTAEARGALKEWRREEEGRGRSSRAAPWPEMVALGDELRRSCSLAAAGNRGEAEEGHGRRRLRGARRRRSRGAATVARERDGGIGLLGVCVVANKKKEAALAGNREGEMHGLGLQGGVAGPPGKWA